MTGKMTLPSELPDSFGGGQEREIFKNYYGRVLGFFRSRGFLEDKARDLTQDTFLCVFCQIHSLRQAEALDAWILRIAVNKWKNEIRHQKAKKRDAEVAIAEVAPGRRGLEIVALTTGDAPSPLEEALASERLAVVTLCLDALPPRMRLCLVLHVSQNLEYQQIAEILKISTEGVRSHIHQARQRLKACAKKRLSGEGR